MNPSALRSWVLFLSVGLPATLTACGTGDRAGGDDSAAPKLDMAITRDLAQAPAVDFAMTPIMDFAMAVPPRSCAELHAKEPNRPDGTAVIDPDGAGPYPAITVQCDMTTDGGGFTLVFNHDLAAAGYLIGFDQGLSANEGDPSAPLYSILKYLSAFKDQNATFTFRIDWPGYAKRNIWSQTTNPTDDVEVGGYRAIDVQSMSNLWGGLELGNGTHSPANGGAAFIDGSVNHPNWYFAIGVRILWGNPNGFPASDDVTGMGMGVNRVRLWVR